MNKQLSAYFEEIFQNFSVVFAKFLVPNIVSFSFLKNENSLFADNKVFGVLLTDLSKTLLLLLLILLLLLLSLLLLLKYFLL